MIKNTTWTCLTKLSEFINNNDRIGDIKEKYLIFLTCLFLCAHFQESDKNILDDALNTTAMARLKQLQTCFKQVFSLSVAQKYNLEAIPDFIFPILQKYTENKNNNSDLVAQIHQFVHNCTLDFNNADDVQKVLDFAIFTNIPLNKSKDYLNYYNRTDFIRLLSQMYLKDEQFKTVLDPCGGLGNLAINLFYNANASQKQAQWTLWYSLYHQTTDDQLKPAVLMNSIIQLTASLCSFDLAHKNINPFYNAMFQEQKFDLIVSNPYLNHTPDHQQLNHFLKTELKLDQHPCKDSIIFWPTLATQMLSKTGKAIFILPIDILINDQPELETWRQMLLNTKTVESICLLPNNFVVNYAKNALKFVILTLNPNKLHQDHIFMFRADLIAETDEMKEASKYEGRYGEIINLEDKNEIIYNAQSKNIDLKQIIFPKLAEKIIHEFQSGLTDVNNQKSEFGRYVPTSEINTILEGKINLAPNRYVGKLAPEEKLSLSELLAVVKQLQADYEHDHKEFQTLWAEVAKTIEEEELV